MPPLWVHAGGKNCYTAAWRSIAKNPQLDKNAHHLFASLSFFAKEKYVNVKLHLMRTYYLVTLPSPRSAEGLLSDFYGVACPRGDLLIEQWLTRGLTQTTLRRVCPTTPPG